MNTELMNLAKNIRRLRNSIEYSQEDLAFESGLNRTYICDVERAARNLSFGSLLKIARGLGTTLSELTRSVDIRVQSQSDGNAPVLSAPASNLIAPTTVPSNRFTDNASASSQPRSASAPQRAE